MKIAILSWGSLIWDRRTLDLTGEWVPNGPVLPVEFARVAGDGRLTAVIDPLHGARVQTHSATSTHSGLVEAVDNLAQREKDAPEWIGYVDTAGYWNSRESRPHQVDVAGQIRRWCNANGYDAAIWTASAAQFEKKTGMLFSVQNALEYLQSLQGDTRERALEYLSRAPEQTATPVRKAAKAAGLI